MAACFDLTLTDTDTDTDTVVLGHYIIPLIDIQWRRVELRSDMWEDIGKEIADSWIYNWRKFRQGEYAWKGIAL